MMSLGRFASATSLVGFSPDFESTRMWEASLERGEATILGICRTSVFDCRCWSFLMLRLARTRSRPRMCRFEVGAVGALGCCSQPHLTEAHSYAPSTFKADQSFGLPTCESTSIAAARTRQTHGAMGPSLRGRGAITT
jgi:hypothetical protein